MTQKKKTRQDMPALPQKGMPEVQKPRDIDKQNRTKRCNAPLVLVRNSLRSHGEHALMLRVNKSHRLNLPTTSSPSPLPYRDGAPKVFVHSAENLAVDHQRACPRLRLLQKPDRADEQLLECIFVHVFSENRVLPASCQGEEIAPLATVRLGHGLSYANSER